MSKAVRGVHEVRMIGSPMVMMTPPKNSTSFAAMCPWSCYWVTTSSNSCALHPQEDRITGQRGG
jgi:hypothetical protein